MEVERLIFTPDNFLDSRNEKFVTEIQSTLKIADFFIGKNRQKSDILRTQKLIFDTTISKKLGRV